MFLYRSFYVDCLENRSCSLGAVALKSSIFSDPSLFTKNRTAPTSPTDMHSSPSSSKPSVFSKELDASPSSPSSTQSQNKQPDSQHGSQQKKQQNWAENQPRDGKLNSSMDNNQHTLIPQTQLVSSTNDVNVSDNSLYQVQCCTKRSQPKNKLRKTSCSIF